MCKYMCVLSVAMVINNVKQYVIEEVILGVVCPLWVVHVVIIYNGKGRLERATCSFNEAASALCLDYVQLEQ